MKYITWLWHNTVGIRLNMLVRIIAGIGRVLLGLLMVWLCKQFIDVTIRTGSDKDIVQMVICIVAVVIGGIICRQIYYYLGVKAEAKQSTSIRLRIFSHLFRRQMFEQKEMHSGDISSRLEKDISTVSSATTSIIPDLCVTTFQLLGAFLLMQVMDERLAWVLLLLTPVFVMIGKAVAWKIRKMTQEIRRQESVIQMLVQESMEHNAVLRSLESGDWVSGRLDNMQQDLRGKVSHRAQFTVLFRLLIGMSFSLGYIVAFIWGGLQLKAGVITFGVMTSFLQLVSQIQQPILQMVNMMPQMFQASASIDRLEEMEHMEAEEERRDDSCKMEEQLGLDIQDVSFHYALGDREILSHFTHQFAPGSKTALMGHTGAGKTTLFRLLLGLIKPDKGTMTLFNADSRQAVSESTRSNFVFVPQGNTLMSGSIRYNLLLAKPDATEEEMRQVLHTAMADFVLNLPEGMDAECGERGSGLSEGQAQRIAIARGLLRPGNIMLLDEISASLDEDTEHELYSRLFAAYPQKTMIFITHRTTVCELCNEVIKLDK
ncbi:MAG: ABC transporter ATP-binding protein [Bacteroidaceae bacterium]|nr:ABC transporter ATP-binding protein [Bacteroidaceae bacterium]